MAGGVMTMATEGKREEAAIGEEAGKDARQTKYRTTFAA
jgi:hypothetical protein